MEHSTGTPFLRAGHNRNRRFRLFLCPIHNILNYNKILKLVGTDGTIYEGEDTDLGMEVVEQAGTRIQVVALPEEEDGVQYLTITSYIVPD